MPIPLEKAQRRLNKVSDDFINKEEKVNFAKVVFPDMMSSEEEKEDRNRKGYLSEKFPHFEIRNCKCWSMSLMPHIFKIVLDVQRNK